MTRVSFVINAFLGSSLIIGLILADYIRRYKIDRVQRGIFLRLLIFTLIPLVCEIIHYLSRGIPGVPIHRLLYTINTIYYAVQVLAYYHLFIFVDYSAFKDGGRTRRIYLIVGIITAAHFLILLANLKGHFYFYFDEGNRFFHGDWYAIRLIFSYLPVLFALYDFLSSPRVFRKNLISLIIIFGFFTAVSSTIDILMGSALLWPCISSALLYGYFFIIRTDSRIDALTGIGNRLAFNELITKLSRQKTRESYAIVMIDMDHFKQINDTLGHLEGDQALKDMAAIIISSIRANDFAVRYGGDEFVILAKVGQHAAEHHTEERAIEKIIQRITEAMGKQNEQRSRPYQLQMSYGYDIYTTNEGRSIQDFLKHIDGLMYKHKEDHRRSTDKEPNKP